ATNDQYGPGAIWLGTHRVDRNPPHVTYVVDRSEDSRLAHAVADHAYWLSGLAPRNAGRIGTIDVRSFGFGVGDPKPSGMKVGAGALTGGTKAAIPYVELRQTWSKPPKTPKRDALVVVARNISRVVVDVHRARVGCAAKVRVSSDGPVRVVLAGCDRTVRAS
ncbi:MAG TPA: hypothetical protein VFJ98_05400, partial [Mycobacteriales bacterium]|nr:hypothetical protein [Mycobacteriales bacterium]